MAEKNLNVSVPPEVKATPANSPEAFANAEKGLAALFGDEPAAAEVKPIKPAVGAKPKQSDPVEPEEEVEETTNDGEAGAEAEAEEAEVEATAEGESDGDGAAATEVPTLPDSHRRSLKAYGWDDSEIDAALTENPDGFRRTASKMHESRVAESQQWAALGRQARQSSTETDDDDAIEQPAQRQSKQVRQPINKSGRMAEIDTVALKAKYGDDPMVDEIVGPVNAAIKQINQVLPGLTDAVQVVRATQAEQLEKQVDGFFNGLKNYDKFYGKDTATCSDEQFEKRNAVLGLADAMVVGAAQQGRRISTADAMQLAHESVSASQRERTIREGIRTSVKKRSKSITLKPGKAGESNSGSQSSKAPKDRNELEARTRARLNAAFGRS